MFECNLYGGLLIYGSGITWNIQPVLYFVCNASHINNNSFRLSSTPLIYIKFFSRIKFLSPTKIHLAFILRFVSISFSTWFLPSYKFLFSVNLLSCFKFLFCIQFLSCIKFCFVSSFISNQKAAH